MKYLFLGVLFFGATSLFSQTKEYSGTWTKVHTTYAFDFELILNIKKSNQVEGYFNWKVVRFDENDSASIDYYQSKIGMTAKEYVKGTYDPVKQEFILNGYKKVDPNQIIGIDTYKLKVDDNGNIEGTTNANGSWLGRINAKQLEFEIL